MLKDLANKIAAHLTAKQWLLAIAESCTGGGVAYCLTQVPGSSVWFERGFVTYSNLAKIEMLGIAPALIETQGAVSEAVARAMAQGALQKSTAQIAVAVTGIAGPTGGSLEKPVGTVWFAWGWRDGATITLCQHFAGDRESIRLQAIECALQGILQLK